MGIVEPVFADIRTQKRLDHFTLRTQAKVNIRWLLYCIVHNPVKITNYGPALQTAWMKLGEMDCIMYLKYSQN
jgi:hypothetical protein